MVKILLKKLKEMYPENKTALNFRNSLELLVSVILSAQCTDTRVNRLTQDLFRKYRSVRDFADADIKELERDIRPAGFYRNKAKSISSSCREICRRYKGKVPDTMEELTSLPGVGRKTANVVLGSAYGVPGITVDTHVKRVSYRLGLTKNKDPVKIEFDLMKLIPKRNWIAFSNALISHGRAVCRARRPMCGGCMLSGICPKAGV